jgi:Secretion system C-terminal sorting domain
LGYKFKKIKMKKILLVGLSLVSVSSFAQFKNSDNKTLFENVKPNLKTMFKPGSGQPKATRANSRWYDPLISTLQFRNGDTTGLDNNTNNVFLWQDTTMLVRYSTSTGSTYLGGIYLKSMAQIFDPTALRFNSPVFNAGELQVKKTDGFTVDSVAFAGFYRRLPSKNNIVDSLIVTVGYGTGSGSTSAVSNQYVLAGTNGASTIACYGTDSMTIGVLYYNFAKMGLDGSNVIRKAIPLTAADSGGKYFQTNLNLVVPAGNKVAMSVDFKSGDTWIPKVDSISNFNSFRAFYTEEVANELQSYNKNDWNSTASLEGDTTGWGDQYVPNYFYIGSACGKTFDREQYWSLYKITSGSTTFVSIDDIKTQVAVNVSPNPATNYVMFDMNFANSFKSTSIQVTNMMGQVVKTATLGKVTANTSKKFKMNIDDLTSGLYIYTITADGKSQSGKLSIK